MDKINNFFECLSDPETNKNEINKLIQDNPNIIWLKNSEGVTCLSMCKGIKNENIVFLFKTVDNALQDTSRVNKGEAETSIRLNKMINPVNKDTITHHLIKELLFETLTVGSRLIINAFSEYFRIFYRPDF